MTDTAEHAEPVLRAEKLAKQLMHFLNNERRTFEYEQFRDELHDVAAAAILALLDKPDAETGLSCAIRYFAASEVASSLSVNSVSSFAVLLSTSDSVVAEVDDAGLFRCAVVDHLCEGTTERLRKLANARAQRLTEELATSAAAAQTARK